MANEPINYKAVLADLEAKKAQIESAISAIKMIAAQAGNTGPGPGSGVGPSAFLKMSIPDATKTLLETTKQKHSTQATRKVYLKRPRQNAGDHQNRRKHQR